MTHVLVTLESIDSGAHSRRDTGLVGPGGRHVPFISRRTSGGGGSSSSSSSRVAGLIPISLGFTQGLFAAHKLN